MGWKIIFMCLFVSGCATPSGDWCDIKNLAGGAWRPTKVEIKTMRIETVDKMLFENKYGQEHCGWEK